MVADAMLRAVGLWRIALAAAIIFGFCYLRVSQGKWLIVLSFSRQHEGDPILKRFTEHGLKDLSSNVTLSSLYLQISWTNANDDNEKLVNDIRAELPAFEPWDPTKDTNMLASEPVISVEIPAAPMTLNASSILFCVATTLERLNESLDTFAHFGSHNGAQFLALLDPNDYDSDDKNESWSDASHAVLARSSQLGVDLEILKAYRGFIERYVFLPRAAQTVVTSNTRWISIIDDDTVFPSMSRLLKMLDQYDSQLPQYIGSVTESMESLAEWGYLAYGGAGMFISLPLVKQIEPHLEECQQFETPSGDGKLGKCISKFTNANFTMESGLHQVDLMGDQSGFYEALRPIPLSTHHWKSWGWYDLVKSTKIASITGENAVFAKYCTRDGWWMSNGFSIFKFSDEEQATAHQNGVMEKTFGIIDESSNTFTDSLGPLRAADPGKTQFMLESVVSETENCMTQYYVKRIDGLGENVIRVIWSKPR